MDRHAGVALTPAERTRLLSDCEAVLRERFADAMVVPYQTRAWLARRR